MDKSQKQWLEALARRWGLSAEVTRQAPVFAWKGAVGEELAKLARPLYVEGHTLHLAVGNHVAAAELRLLSRQLLARLKQVVPDSPVERLKFKVIPESPPPREVRVEEPAPTDWEEAETDVPRGLPPELRERLIKIAAWARARDRALLAAGGRRCPRCGVVYRGASELCPVCSLVAGEGEE